MDGREGQFLIASWLVSLTVGRRPPPTLRRWCESSRLTITKPHNRSHFLHTITPSPTFSLEHRATNGLARSQEVSRGGQEPQQPGSQPGSNCRSASDFSGLGRRGLSCCCVHHCPGLLLLSVTQSQPNDTIRDPHSLSIHLSGPVQVGLMGLLVSA